MAYRHTPSKCPTTPFLQEKSSRAASCLLEDIALQVRIAERVSPVAVELATKFPLLLVNIMILIETPKVSFMSVRILGSQW